jgi:glutathione S-transferase
MAYTLIGSFTSPYVRKLRIILENQACEFRNFDIFKPEDAVELNKLNPLNQVPALIADGQTILDSRVIFNYLNSVHQFETRSIDDENILSIIDGAINAGVTLVYARRSGLNTEDQNAMLFQRQHERIKSALLHLKAYTEHKASQQWNFNSISLYCFADWALFREVITLEQYPFLKGFMDAHAQRPSVLSTQIPRA